MKQYLNVVIGRLLKAYPNTAFRLWRVFTKSLPIVAAVAQVKFDLEKFGFADEERSLPVMFPVQDTVIISALLRDGIWEPVELRCVFRKIRTDFQYNVLDVGANIGLFSLQLEILLRALGRDRQIVGYHCFEPVAQMRLCLEHNTRQMSAKSSVYPYAIGAVDEERDMYLDASNGGNNSLLSEAVERKIGAVRVCVRRLDTLLEELKIPLDNPIILKMDIQGLEPLALSCVPESLWNKMEIALLEFTPTLMRNPQIADAFARVCLELRRFSACYRISAAGDEAIDIMDLKDLVESSTVSHVNLLFVK